MIHLNTTLKMYNYTSIKTSAVLLQHIPPQSPELTIRDQRVKHQSGLPVIPCYRGTITKSNLPELYGDLRIF